MRATLNEQGVRGGPNEVVYSPDGKTLASTDEGGILLWDLKTGKEHDPPPSASFAFPCPQPGRQVAGDGSLAASWWVSDEG